MGAEEQPLELVRGQVGAIILGTVHCFAGLAACAIAAIRRRHGTRILLWFGAFALMYGLRMLAQTDAFSLLPSSTWPIRPYLIGIIDYFLLVPSTLFWLELTRGGLRRLITAVAVASLLIAIAGVVALLVSGPDNHFPPYNGLLAIGLLLVIGAVIAIPRLARKFMTVSSPVLSVGILAVVATALYTNLSQFVFYQPLPIEPLVYAGFALLLGYVAAQQVFRNERRLLSIETELEIARTIQKSILPTSVPPVSRLRIAAEYHPMSAVAGDFYEFIPIDSERVGFFVADVSGHGVPAALVASMLKVAMRSVAARADAPAALLGELNRSFADQLHGQFVTAAYLYVDLTAGHALYSAAGHPPLLHWDSAARDLRLVESNGLLFGVLKETNYPVRELALQRGDRFVLYTDGLTEAENSAGEAFGDGRLGELIRSHADAPAGELSAHILQELLLWRHSRTAQQDDITWIVVDVL